MEVKAWKDKLSDNIIVIYFYLAKVHNKIKKLEKIHFFI